MVWLPKLKPKKLVVAEKFYFYYFEVVFHCSIVYCVLVLELSKY
jgi:hypothetical protein